MQKSVYVKKHENCKNILLDAVPNDEDIQTVEKRLWMVFKLVVHCGLLMILIFQMQMSIAYTVVKKPKSYIFTKIATSEDAPSDWWSSAHLVASMNNEGVITLYTGKGGIPRDEAIYTGNGGTLTTVISVHSGISDGHFDHFHLTPPSINDQGTVAFQGHIKLWEQEIAGTFIANNGAITIIDNGAFYLMHGVDINNSNLVAFLSTKWLDEDNFDPVVYSGNGHLLNTIADTGFFDRYHNPPDYFAINDRGTVAFWAYKANTIDYGVYTGDGIATSTIFIPKTYTGRRYYLTPPAINNNGTVAFWTLGDDGHEAIFTSNGGTLTTYVSTKYTDNYTFFTSVDALSSCVAINDNDKVAFHGRSYYTEKTGIYTGTDPINDKVIAEGDPLFGSTVTDCGVIRKGFNNKGQVAFWAKLANGTVGYFRADPDESNYKPAVLLIHGWNRECESYDVLKPWLVQNLDILDVRVECFNPMKDSGIDGYAFWKGTAINAKILKEYIENPETGFLTRMDPIRDGKIDIVAHSYGGLVARYYIEKLGGSSKVRSLTMLGTPNMGTIAADLNNYTSFTSQMLDKYGFFRKIGPITIREDMATWDMRIDSNKPDGLLYALNTGYIQKPPSTLYRVVVGLPQPSESILFNMMYNYWTDILGSEHDCLVPVYSAKGPFPFNVPVERDSVHPSTCGSLYPRRLIDDPPFTDCKTDPEHVFCDILKMIDSSKVRAVPTRPELAKKPDRVATLQTEIPNVAGSGLMGGLIMQNGEDTHVATVDASALNATFSLSWAGTNDAIHLTLRRPDGSMVNKSDSDVTYIPPSEIGDGSFIESYVVNSPSVGNWTLDVKAVTVPEEGQVYAVFCNMNSPITMSFESQFAIVNMGQAVTLKSTLQELGMAIKEATVMVTVTRPDGFEEVLIMVDDGTGADTVADDGIYTGTFTTASNMCGIYKLDVKAYGNAEKGSFIRGNTAFISALYGSDNKCSDLVIAMADDPDPVRIGSNLVYSLKVTNNGCDMATGIVLTDTLPDGVTLVSVTQSQGTWSGTNVVTCKLGELDRGESAAVTIVVSPQITGKITNEVSVTGIEIDPNNTNNSATAVTTVVGTPPKVVTGQATNVTKNLARLSGTVNPNGLSTTARFEYGKNSGVYTRKTRAKKITGDLDVSVNSTIRGLSPGKKYYYRLAAENNAGASYGSELSFTTLSK